MADEKLSIVLRISSESQLFQTPNTLLFAKSITIQTNKQRVEEWIKWSRQNQWDGIF